MTIWKKTLGKVLVLGCVLLWAAPVLASSSHYSPGVDNFERGTLPPEPGLYTKHYFIYYTANNLRDNKGAVLDVPGRGSQFQLNSANLVNRFLWVTGQKFLGADVALHALVPLATTSFTDPVGKGHSATSLSDSLAEVLLGWHGDRWDAILGLGAWVPVGYYDVKNPASPGKGFWSGMGTVGLTYYLDAQKDWAVGGHVRYEVNGADMHQDVWRGNYLTLEGALSKKIHPLVEVGVAGFAQFQTSPDNGNDLDPMSFDGQGVLSRSIGVGPEIKVIIPQMQGYISVNYMKEFCVINRPEGHIMSANVILSF